MNTKDIYELFMGKPKLMQLATVDDKSKPWICTVYFVGDEDGPIYWHSAKDRLHSQHVINNPEVAATVVYDENTKRAVQISGKAEIMHVADTMELTRIHDLYTSKIGGSQTRLEETLASTHDGRAYWKLTSEAIHIWDELEFKENPKQVVL